MSAQISASPLKGEIWLVFKTVAFAHVVDVFCSGANRIGFCFQLSEPEIEVRLLIRIGHS